MKRYFRRNYLAFVVILLFIVTIVLFMLPGATVVLKSMNYNYTYEGASYPISLASEQTLEYSVFEILGGRIDSVPITGHPQGVTSANISFFIPFNVFLGLGLLVLLVAVVMMAVDNRIVRIVGAGLGLIGSTLASIFLFNQVTDSDWGYPVRPFRAVMDYQLTYNFGTYLVLAMIILTGLACVGYCVLDNIKRYQFEKSESERYLRGGI